MLQLLSSVVYLWLPFLVRLDAADEKGLAVRQSFHERVQRLAELTAQRWHLLGVASLVLRHGKDHHGN